VAHLREKQGPSLSSNQASTATPASYTKRELVQRTRELINKNRLQNHHQTAFKHGDLSDNSFEFERSQVTIPPLMSEIKFEQLDDYEMTVESRFKVVQQQQ
jgi:hypothetical protein